VGGRTFEGGVLAGHYGIAHGMWGHTKPQTNRCRKWKAILGPAGPVLCAQLAGKNYFVQQHSAFFHL